MLSLLPSKVSSSLIAICVRCSYWIKLSPRMG
nr:MAG TPA: hypothetical protein [Caudoviricetes sp.]